MKSEMIRDAFAFIRGGLVVLVGVSLLQCGTNGQGSQSEDTLCSLIVTVPLSASCKAEPSCQNHAACVHSRICEEGNDGYKSQKQGVVAQGG